MNNVTGEMAAALRERLAIIQDQVSRQNPAAHMARLQAVSEKIETLAARLPPDIDRRLSHYLERRSYEKALELLEASFLRRKAYSESASDAPPL
jgi:hypothetical protein